MGYHSLLSQALLPCAGLTTPHMSNAAIPSALSVYFTIKNPELFFSEKFGMTHVIFTRLQKSSAARHIFAENYSQHKVVLNEKLKQPTGYQYFLNYQHSQPLNF